MTLNILMVIEKNSWVESHIVRALELMGNRVSRFYLDNYVGEFYGYHRRDEQIKKNRMLVERAKQLCSEKQLDLIFCYVYDDFLMSKYAKQLSALGVPMINYNVDMPTQWYRQIRTAEYFNYMLCAQPDYMDNLSRYAQKVLYFPMAALPTVHLHQFETFNKQHEVTFLGTALPYRRRLLCELAKFQIPFTVYGKYWDTDKTNTCIRSFEKTALDIVRYGWPRVRTEGIKKALESLSSRIFTNTHDNDRVIPPEYIKGQLETHELPLLFQQSKINIGLTRYAENDPNKVGRCQMKLRDFEVPMAGGFYLVEKSPGYDTAFINGEEVIMWQTAQELREKIQYYLAHEDERRAIALKGQKRAISEHTWQHRFNTLFQALGIDYAHS